MMRLAGVQEVAELLGVDEAIVAGLPWSEALTRAGVPFPQPLAELEQGPIWDRDEVEEWKHDRAQAWRRAPAGSAP